MAYRKTAAVKAKSAATRESILDAAEFVLARYDDDRLTSRVTEKAGIGWGTLYTQFADAHELRAAVVTRALARDREAIVTADGIGAALSALYANWQTPRLARVLFNAPAYRGGIRKALEPPIRDAGNPPRASEYLAAAVLAALIGLSETDATNRTACIIALRAIGMTQAMAEKAI